jgi:acyl carrier protein
MLANIWASVLHVERVGIHDNFFDRGGHSLMATQVMSRLREAFGVELPVSRLFERPNLTEFASLIEDTLLLKIENLSEEEARHWL